MGLIPVSPWEIQMKQQTEWIQDLLEYVTFEHTDIVIVELENSHHLLMVSDSSGRAKSMTFGWVLRAFRVSQ